MMGGGNGRGVSCRGKGGGGEGGIERVCVCGGGRGVFHLQPQQAPVGRTERVAGAKEPVR